MSNETQTSPSIPEEWLSAYLDGELTADEVHAVDAALEESPELRSQLDELRGVSELLKSLPQPKLEGDFVESLVLDTRVRRSAGLPWKLGMTTSALVAASLVAGVLWIQSTVLHDSEPMVAFSTNDADNATSLEFESAAMDAVAPAPTTAALAGDTAFRFGSQADELAVDPQAFFTTNRPEPGQLLHVLETIDGNVVVVECLVVDVNEAREKLEVTLASLGLENSSEIAEGSSPENNGLFAVFVQADEPVVQAVMDRTRGKDFGVPVVSNRLYAGSAGNAEARRSRFSVPSRPLTDSFIASDDAGGRADMKASLAKPIPAAPVAEPKSLSAATAQRAEEKQATKMMGQQKATAGDPETAPKEASTTAKLVKIGPEERRQVVNNYQVVLNVSNESLTRIQGSNSFVPVSSPQRVLVVLKAAKSPEVSGADANKE